MSHTHTVVMTFVVIVLEVYDFQEWSDESSSEDLEEEGAHTFDENPQDAAVPRSSKEWTWDMPLQDRMRRAGFRFLLI